MRILLTNDDGIYAKGIEVLHEHLSKDHDVAVVAPETEQSAVGHAITLTDPLRVKSIDRNGTFFWLCCERHTSGLCQAGCKRTHGAAAGLGGIRN